MTSSQSRQAPDSIASPDSPTLPDEDEDDTDLYGNPVTAAVAQYKFDRAGSLYELHSPQTEVPRLKPPRT